MSSGVDVFLGPPLSPRAVLAQAFGSVLRCLRSVEGDRPVPKMVLEALSR